MNAMYPLNLNMSHVLHLAIFYNWPELAVQQHVLCSAFMKRLLLWILNLFYCIANKVASLRLPHLRVTDDDGFYLNSFLLTVKKERPFFDWKKKQQQNKQHHTICSFGQSSFGCLNITLRWSTLTQYFLPVVKNCNSKSFWRFHKHKFSTLTFIRLYSREKLKNYWNITLKHFSKQLFSEMAYWVRKHYCATYNHGLQIPSWVYPQAKRNDSY